MPVRQSLETITNCLVASSHSGVHLEGNIGKLSEILETMFKYIESHVQDMRHGILDRFKLLNGKSEEELSEAAEQMIMRIDNAQEKVV